MPCFTSTSSGSHLRTVFPSCQQLFSSSTLLLVLGASTGKAGTSRTHRTGSHPLDSLFCTFFTRSEHRAAQASQTQILLPLGKREATTVRLRASDGLAAPSSSVFFIPVFIPHSNSQLLGVFKAPVSLNRGLLRSPADTFHSWTRQQTCQGKLILFLLFSSRKGTDEIFLVVTRGKTSPRYLSRRREAVFQRELHWDTALYFPNPSPHLQKIAKRGWK